MKITSGNHAEQLKQLQKNGEAAKLKEAGDFSKFLKEGGAASAEMAKKSEASPNPLSMVNNSGLAGMIMASRGVAEAKSSPREQLESTLGKMEEYAGALGDSGKTLKDIAPLAEDMRRLANNLSETSHRLPDDHPLKGMTNEAAVLATVEAMKFTRGDYV